MEIYTLKEVSENLKISYRTAVREVHRGNLKAIRKGREFLVFAEDLKSYKQNQISIATLKVGVALVIHGTEMLIVKRRYPEGRLIWQMPAGLLRPNRPAEDIIKEICITEANIEITVVKKIGSRIAPDTKAHITYFLCEYLSGEAQNLTPLSNEEVKWIERKDALKYFTSSVYERLLEYFV